MALVGLIGPDEPAKDAARLHELNISALAFVQAGLLMELAARATKTVPSLCLTPVQSREDALAARFHGADGVCVDALLPLEDWDRLAKSARTMRMLTLALAESAEGAAAAVKAGARAVLLRAASAEEILAAAAAVPRSMTILADVINVSRAGAAALRPLLGHVDAAIVPPDMHASPEFAEFVGEVDP